MASTVAAFAPLAVSVFDLIGGLVHKHAPVIEADNGPSTGPLKFQELFLAVMKDLRTAAESGMIPKEMPADDTVKAVLQAGVKILQITGVLNATNAAALAGVLLPTAASPSAIVLNSGQTLTISAK